jgi:hypothetical protein
LVGTDLRRETKPVEKKIRVLFPVIPLVVISAYLWEQSEDGWETKQSQTSQLVYSEHPPIVWSQTLVSDHHCNEVLTSLLPRRKM